MESRGGGSEGFGFDGMLDLQGSLTGPKYLPGE